MFLKQWRTERDELTAKKSEIEKIYLPLKDEIANIERIRKNVCEIMQLETHDTTTKPQNISRKKYHGMEL